MDNPSPFRSRLRTGPAGPLTGVKVLDLSAYIAGPYGCTLLADQGADVISQHTDSPAPLQVAEARGKFAFGQASGSATNLSRQVGLQKPMTVPFTSARLSGWTGVPEKGQAALTEATPSTARAGRGSGPGQAVSGRSRS